MATETKPKAKTRTYFSTGVHYQIPRVKPDEQVLPNGKTVVRNMADYERYMLRFEHNFLRLEEGQDVLPTGPEGEEEDAVAFLERQPAFGTWFRRQDDPVPEPTAEELSEITRLAASGNEEGLRAALLKEEEGHDREPVKAAIRSALSIFGG